MILTDDNPFIGDGICSFCEGRASAYWHGRTVVYICDSCSTHVLPKLLADSIAGTYRALGPRLLSNQVSWHLDRFISEFWRAQFLALVTIEQERRQAEASVLDEA